MLDPPPVDSMEAPRTRHGGLGDVHRPMGASGGSPNSGDRGEVTLQAGHLHAHGGTGGISCSFAGLNPLRS